MKGAEFIPMIKKKSFECIIQWENDKQKKRLMKVNRVWDALWYPRYYC